MFVFSVEIRASGNPMCMTLCNEEGSFGVLRVVKGSLPTSFTQVKTHNGLLFSYSHWESQSDTCDQDRKVTKMKEGWSPRPLQGEKKRWSAKKYRILASDRSDSQYGQASNLPTCFIPSFFFLQMKATAYVGETYYGGRSCTRDTIFRCARQ